jgi:hypothetical protein
MDFHGEVEVQLHAFLTLALGEDDWSASHIGLFTSGAHFFLWFWICPVRMYGKGKYKEIRPCAVHKADAVSTRKSTA